MTFLDIGQAPLRPSSDFCFCFVHVGDQINAAVVSVHTRPRSIKKQYQKMVKVLSSYAVVSVGVNISVTNISKVRPACGCCVYIVSFLLFYCFAWFA